MNNLIILGNILVLLILLSNIVNMKNDITRMNITLNKIAKQIGVTNTSTDNIDVELKNELISLISDGSKIKAIKKYRMVTGSGLKEAEEYVSSLMSRI